MDDHNTNKLCAGLLAHVDAGKTTLAEALLFTSGTIRKLGRVDKKDCHLDNFDQERERGITIFSKQALLSHKGTDITLLDTPGHVDFSSEMERSLSVMDCAILVISGTDGVQAHTETLWVLLKKYKVPTFIFITKMDVSQFSRSAIMEDLRLHLGEECVSFSSGDRTDDFEEQLAVLDEQLLDRYMESAEIPEEDIRQLVSSRKLFPCFFGSGLKLDGTEELLDALSAYAPRRKYPEAFGARVFKIGRDSRGNRLTYLKVTGGGLSVRTSLRYLPLTGDPLEEKISEIRLYSGAKFITSENVLPGTVCTVLGLSQTRPGQGLGIEPDLEQPLLEPVLSYKIALPSGTDALTFLPKLRILEEEDPQLHVTWNSHLKEIGIQLMGAVQIDVIKELIRERFGIEVQICEGHVLYKETISSPVEGIGHYEPLKHYSEVHLLLEPGEPGSGIVADTVCPLDDLDLNWQRLILTHIEEKEHVGVLTGSPITDIRITLLAGKAHLKHTEGGDFRQSTYRAIREGLMHAKNVLLEPVFEYTLEVPPENIGRAITDIHAMGGEHSSPESIGDRMVITGIAPVAEMAGYPQEVLAYTGGRGRISCRSAGYRPCRNAETVIENAGYDPESDLENSPDSIFCSHGAGFNVRWNLVPEYCHIPPIFPSGSTSSGTAAPGAEEQPPVSARPAAASHITDIDEKELERIMEREFGPIRRKQYSAPTVYNAPGKARASERKPERIIVDGYNVIFGWEELKELASTSIDTAREKLTDILINYAAFTESELVLVFDAYRVPGGKGAHFDRSGIHIAYTKEGESADMYIERITSEIGKNESVRVITSDSLIRLAAMRSGVLRTSTKEFKYEVDDVLAQIQDKINGKK